MKKKLAVVTTVIMTSFVAGCFTHTFTVGAGSPTVRDNIVYNKWHAHHLYGLINNGNALKISELCPSGNATINERTTFINGLLGGVIGLIYAPTTVTVWCADKSARLELDSKEVMAIVTSPLFPEWVADATPERLGEAVAALRNP